MHVETKKNKKKRLEPNPIIEIDNRKFYRISEVEKRISMSYKKILYCIKKQELKALKISGRWYVLEDDVEKMLNQLRKL